MVIRYFRNGVWMLRLALHDYVLFGGNVGDFDEALSALQERRGYVYDVDARAMGWGSRNGA